MVIMFQFEKVSLEATVYLLNNSYLATEGLGNVVQVVRALTAMVSVHDALVMMHRWHALSLPW